MTINVYISNISISLECSSLVVLTVLGVFALSGGITKDSILEVMKDSILELIRKLRRLLE